MAMKLSSQIGAAPAQPGSLRAQLLATEHWSLLATRSQTWSEVMGRITIHLTVSSAAIVALALVAQASGFGARFQGLAIGLAAIVLLLGTLTAVRVYNASTDDLALVLGMNRLRAAYVALDPGIEAHLVAGSTDDLAGIHQTYGMVVRRNASQVLGSAAFFVSAVNAIVAGVLCALVTDALGAGVVAVAIVGVVGGLVHLVVMAEMGRRQYLRFLRSYEPHFPTVPG